MTELEQRDAWAKEIVDAAFKVHRALGPGLLESVYESCLSHDLAQRGLRAERQIPIPIFYNGGKSSLDSVRICWFNRRSSWS